MAITYFCTWLVFRCRSTPDGEKCHQKETVCDFVQLLIAWMGEFNYL